MQFLVAIQKLKRQFAVLLFLLLSPVLQAQVASGSEPSTQPILRIESMGNTALPRSVALDEKNGVFYTGGDDKAVRVRRQADMRLLDTWRLPSGTGPEGQINAVALTPNGKFLAVGGWTGYEWDRVVSIYVFDTSNGQITKRISGLPAAVGALQFSDDGELLAIGLVGKGGLLVTHWNDGKVVFQDADFPSSVLGMDIAGDNLAVVGFNAGLRVYDLRTGRVRRQSVLKEGALPINVKFSPTGEMLAVGFHDSALIGVYDAKFLDVKWVPNLSTITGQINLSVPVWSQDGRYLYAGGDPRPGQPAKIFRWETLSAETPRAFTVAKQRLADLVSARNGSLFFLAEDPEIGRIGLDGTAEYAPAGGTMDMRTAQGSLTLSSDGMQMELATDVAKRKFLSFDVTRLQVVQGAQRKLVAPVLAITVPVKVGWKFGEAVATINERVAELKEHEFVRAVTNLPNGDPVLGTEYGVRLFTASGQLKWFSDVGGIAWAINTSADGRYIVAAAGDGGVHWLRATDGARVLSLFVHSSSGEWVAWTPSGYYASSPYGDELIGWQINRSKVERADFYHASQFERVLYRPDIIRSALNDSDRLTLSTPQTGFQIDQLTTIAPPRIEIMEMVPQSDSKQPGRIRARFKATQTGGKMMDWTVFVDDIPITRASERMLSSKETISFTREFDFVPLTAASTVRIEVGTKFSLGVKEVALPLTGKIPEQPLGNLYVVAIGVRKFAALPSKFELDFTERDAEQVAAFFKNQEGRQYRQTHVQIVSDNSGSVPTAASIRNALSFLKQAGPNDTVILFLASHGLRDERGNYYFAAADSRVEDLCSILKGDGTKLPEFCQGINFSVADRATFVEWKTFYDALSAAAGRRLLVVDTCEAGNITGRSETGTLRKRSASSRFSLLLAAGDGEESQEYVAGKHGLFTYAWLKALKNPTNGDRATLIDSFQKAKTDVEMLRDRRVGPMTPSLDGPELWRAMPLARTVP